MRARDLVLAGRRPEGVVDLVDKNGRRLQLLHLGEEARPAARSSTSPRLSVFREAATGLLRVAHRELVLRFASWVPASRRRAILADAGCALRRFNPFISDQIVVSPRERRPTGLELIALANEWMEMDEVVFAAPSFLSEYRRERPPSMRPEEWHLCSHSASAGVRVTAAWERTLGEPGIVVAVLDDGVDLAHPNLRPNLWSNPEPMALDRLGRDFSADLEEPGHLDPRPKCLGDIHGTPCAGLIAAAGIEGGSVGVAPGCRVLPVKIFRGDDLACDEGVANAIRYAALHADVLSCSWIGGSSPDVRQALEDAGTLGRQGLGAAVFCAAGNRQGAPVAFPASDLSTIAIGASTDLGTWAEYSNRGPEISVVAPSSGGFQRIFTTDVSLPGRGYSPGDLHTNKFGGTSAATAITAGVAALVLSVHPGLDRWKLKNLLEETAQKIGGGYNALGHSLEMGHGRVDAGRAVEEAARRFSASPACSGKAYSTRPPSWSRPLRSS
ncbi:MAG TPA: S8 family serine peptidase [Thermoanaerobaculia bacterium]|nr:S8 family serine peptidase [Thermoanaerobaculia bacterium]